MERCLTIASRLRLRRDLGGFLRGISTAHSLFDESLFNVDRKGRKTARRLLQAGSDSEHLLLHLSNLVQSGE